MKENIIAQVQRLIVQGHGKADVLEWLKKEHPKEKGEALYKKAVAFFTDHAMNKIERLGFCQESARYLYQKMVEVGDYSGALRAIQEVAKLSDSYETAKSIEDEPGGEGHNDSEQLLRLIKNGNAS